jgi:hypothetical protein
MPLDSNRSAAPSRLPQMTTTEVVPSPASTSWALDSWTSILAVGCMTDMLLSIVLPSLVMMVSPLPLRIILSIPRGPSDVLMASATAATGQHHGLPGGFSRGCIAYLWRRRCWRTGQPAASPCPESRGQQQLRARCTMRCTVFRVQGASKYPECRISTPSTRLCRCRCRHCASSFSVGFVVGESGKKWRGVLLRQAVWCSSVDFQVASSRQLPLQKVPLQGGTGFFQSGAGVVPAASGGLLARLLQAGAQGWLALAALGLDRFQPRRALGPRQHGITEQPSQALASSGFTAVASITASNHPSPSTTPHDLLPQNPPQPSICDGTLP